MELSPGRRQAYDFLKFLEDTATAATPSSVLERQTDIQKQIETDRQTDKDRQSKAAV